MRKNKAPVRKDLSYLSGLWFDKGIELPLDLATITCLQSMPLSTLSVWDFFACYPLVLILLKLRSCGSIFAN